LQPRLQNHFAFTSETAGLASSPTRRAALAILNATFEVPDTMASFDHGFNLGNVREKCPSGVTNSGESFIVG
jgi:hypothetical protein